MCNCFVKTFGRQVISIKTNGPIVTEAHNKIFAVLHLPPEKIFQRQIWGYLSKKANYFGTPVGLISLALVTKKTPVLHPLIAVPGVSVSHVCFVIIRGKVMCNGLFL